MSEITKDINDILAEQRSSSSIKEIDEPLEKHIPKKVCCEELPSFLWFLKSSWPENQLVSEEVAMSPSMNDLETQDTKTAKINADHELPLERSEPENILIASTQDENASTKKDDEEETDVISPINTTKANKTMNQGTELEETGENIPTTPSHESKSVLTDEIDPYAALADGPSIASMRHISPKQSLLVSPSFTSRTQSFLMRRETSFDVKASLTYSKDLFENIEGENVSSSRGDEIIAAAVGQNQGSLVGWQIYIEYSDGIPEGIYVIAGVKRNRLIGGKSLFLVLHESDYTPDGKTNWDKAERWIPLKRAVNKGGSTFKLLRQVVTIDQD